MTKKGERDDPDSPFRIDSDESSHMQRICVFCGSRSGTNPIHADEAARLGTILAQRGIGLVYGGGSIGLMGVVARAVISARGSVVGVLPESLAAKEIVQRDVTELHIVETMHQRKALMADRSDAFLALPGGFGTCDELFEILTWAQLGIHTKPVAILNTNGFFDPMLAFLDHMVGEGFLSVKNRSMLMVATSINEVLEMVTSHRPTPIVEKWLDADER